MEIKANNFYDLLIDLGYRNENDKKDDIDDMVEDFMNAFRVAPRLINLLAEISDR